MSLWYRGGVSTTIDFFNHGFLTIVYIKGRSLSCYGVIVGHVSTAIDTSDLVFVSLVAFNNCSTKFVELSRPSNVNCHISLGRTIQIVATKHTSSFRNVRSVVQFFLDIVIVFKFPILRIGIILGSESSAVHVY